MRVLVIDDSPVMRTALADALASAVDASVQAAASGEEGLALLTATPADVVLVDARMPGMDGMEVCRRIRALDDPPPVIMLSAYDEAGFAGEAAEAGAAAFVEKSGGLGAIIDALERLTT